MPKVFVSYRRDDSADAAGRLHDRLCTEFGSKSVFIDVDNIPFGVDFRKHLATAVGRCDILLAVIGDSWIDARDSEGKRRLDDESDFVRIEIATALERRIPVIPILIGDSPVPRPEQLPDDLHDLAFRNAAQLRAGAHFNAQVDRLINGIRKQDRKRRPQRTPPPTSTRSQSRNVNRGTQKQDRPIPKANVARSEPLTAVRIMRLLLLLDAPSSLGAKVFRVLFRSGLIVAAIIWLLITRMAGVGSNVKNYDYALVFTSFFFLYIPLFLFAWVPCIVLDKRARNHLTEADDVESSPC